MRIEDCGGKYGNVLRLCYQTNLPLTAESVESLIRPNAVHWAPKKARSYTIISVEKDRGGYSCAIAYFTKRIEGDNAVGF